MVYSENVDALPVDRLASKFAGEDDDLIREGMAGQAILYEAIRASDRGCGAPDPLRRSIGLGRSESGTCFAGVFPYSPARQISACNLPRRDSVANKVQLCCWSWLGRAEAGFLRQPSTRDARVELPVTHNPQADGGDNNGTVSTAPALVDNYTLFGRDKIVRLDWNPERKVGLARQVTALAGERNTACLVSLQCPIQRHSRTVTSQSGISQCVICRQIENRTRTSLPPRFIYTWKILSQVRKIFSVI